MNSYSLFRRSRLRLALWYAGVMGVILSVSGLGMYRAMVQTKWAGMEREIESIAGTLHDSVEPLLPPSEEPTAVLQQIFPDLCLSGQPCKATPTLIQRHTIGISDRTTYYIRLFNHQGKLLAFSPNQPLSLPPTLNRSSWQTFRTAKGIRYHQFTTILHSANTHPLTNEANADSSWGYLQIGRTLEHFDAEIRRIQWIMAIGLPIALSLVATSSWWLSGLAMQPIYQSYQQQQQFTANAAHELRSPLASLLATVEAILRIPQSNQQDIQIMLHTVERQGRRLSHLIADLLLLTSLEQNSGAKPFQPCCLNDVVSDLTEEFLEMATAADINLTCQIPTCEVYTLGNESQLYRLVSNLIANAIQYTPSGGYVTVNLVKSDYTALIAVKDTGVGIELADQKRIFDRFYRVDSDAYGGLRLRSCKTVSTGLGLAIAVAIAQKHQAHLKVESQVGKGSIFTLEVKIVSSGNFSTYSRL
ncbi:two-component system sensor histidine kinase RppB [Nodularia spumigena]|jgi:two-component system, OmpR family, Ni(II)-sensor and/or redox sensor kinase NrsS|uniref:histidine kinase n=2 Tax=Nodularia spumigena TaxID=70799 RepID=A0ABU5UWA8_NODSP|nr:two-component system sensor histidine kinase RppB [Nodularia spumigena]EAW43190.1 sensory transduction histidine kinase [Nodularia spumigena CCY9414]MEA5526919.1 two-component system sensor histidine kinase RppB [Nodularia spumigena UHCC 0143]MEA5610143.1 two-component system sensor histidine kinase RppB [Nodularia spumigena UHCC 0060]